MKKIITELLAFTVTSLDTLICRYISTTPSAAFGMASAFHMTVRVAGLMVVFCDICFSVWPSSFHRLAITRHWVGVKDKDSKRAASSAVIRWETRLDEESETRCQIGRRARRALNN